MEEEGRGVLLEGGKTKGRQRKGEKKTRKVRGEAGGTGKGKR